MDKQIKYLLGMLVLLLISAYFISLLGGLPQYFKEDIIAFLEERVSGEISFSSVSLWPLNRLRLNEFEFIDQEGNIFKADQLNLDYSLNFDGEEIFEIEFIELNQGEIKLEENFLSENQFSEVASDSEEEFNALDFLSELKLPQFLMGLDLNITDSKLVLNTDNLSFELSNLQLGLKADTEDIYTANLSTAVSINNIELQNNLSISNFNLSKIEIQFRKDQKTGSLYFNSSDFELQQLVNNLDKNNFNYQNLDIDLNNLIGLAAAKGEIVFEESKLQSYNSEIDFKNLKLKTVYNIDQAENEEINFSVPDLEIAVEGPDLKMAFDNSKFLIDDNSLNLSLKYKGTANYQLQAEASDFNLEYKFLQPYLSQGNFDFNFNLSAKNNKITRAAAEINAAEVDSDFFNIEQSQMKLRLNENKIFVDQANFILTDQSQLNLKGSYNLKDENYLLSAEADNFRLSETLISAVENLDLVAVNEYSTYLEELKNDRLNFLIDVAGIYGQKNELSAAGDIDLDFELADADNNFQLETSFWYYQDNLKLSSFKLNSDFGRLDLMGEADLDEQSFKIRYAAKNIDLGNLNRVYGIDLAYLNQVNPTIEYMEGSILDSFSNPTVNLRLRMRELEYQSYVLENINLKSTYQNDRLIVKSLSAVLNQASVKATGEINNISALEQAELNLNFNSENLYFQDLSEFANRELPLTGEVQISAALNGVIEDYNLDFQFSAANSIFEFQGDEFEFSELKAVIKKENGDFIINELTARHQNLNLNAAGDFNLNEGFDVDLKLDGFELGQYFSSYQYAAENLSGSLALSGNLSGDLEEAVFEFQVEGEKINFADLSIEIADNSLKYNIFQNKISINNFNFNIDSGQYKLSGEVFDLTDDIKSEVNLELVQVPSRSLALKFIDFYPLAQELVFRGNLDISSQGSDYNAAVDLEANTADNSGGELSINGNLSQALNIDFEASNLQLDFNSKQYDFNLNLTSNLDFSGSLEGSINSPVLRLSHQLTQVSINNTGLELINGEILVENRRRFSASETVEFREGGNLNLDGSYSFLDEELNVSSSLNSLPVDFVLSFIGEDIDASGEINGNFRAEGSMESPNLGGSLSIAGQYLELGLSDPIENYTGEITLSDGSAVVESLEGDFADGDFTINGDIDLFDLENSWDLSLNGENLYFQHGSLEGLFDTELNFVGPLRNPVLEGDIRTYDFVIGIPFEWPTAEVEEGVFVPRIELNIVPENNVTVESDNMEVSVESGSLDLLFDPTLADPLQMEGRYRSTEGIFSYYNSRFNLENAEAVFTPVDENDIPTLRVNAITYAGGREITINVSGPADDMRITLSSDSDMTEDEILNLLSTRGALGSAIIGGEDIGIQTIIMQELIRILNSFLQQDIISDIESDFKTAFSLDTIEINAYQFGLEREFELRLGKNITDRLYLEYTTFFREGEQEGEISFEYELADPTVLKGTYYGDDDYQISIETEFEF